MARLDLVSLSAPQSALQAGFVERIEEHSSDRTTEIITALVDLWSSAPATSRILSPAHGSLAGRIQLENVAHY